VDPNVVHSAYTNNVNGALTTQLYGIDTGNNSLVAQANNTGALTLVAPLGLAGGASFGASGGFDVSGVTGVAYVALQPDFVGGNFSRLYVIDLANGALSGGQGIDGGIVITALTVAEVPEPSTPTPLLSTILGGLFRRRRRL
jgi:hypothetical protein